MNKRLYKKKVFGMYYYYYTLTSNSTYKVIKKTIKENPQDIDIRNLTTKNYFLTKLAAITAADKFMATLQNCFKRGKNK